LLTFCLKCDLVSKLVYKYNLINHIAQQLPKFNGIFFDLVGLT